MAKRIMITGATGKIGKAIAETLAADHGNTLILVGRNREKCEAAIADIKSSIGSAHIEYDLCDVSRKIFVEALFASSVSAWPEGARLDVLINCAAAAPPSKRRTPEGYELQWATNVLGYYWMMETFLPLMSKGGRIVNVASYWAGGLDLDDPMFERSAYSNGSAYRASKQADRMLTGAFAKIAKETAEGITVNACHPGDVNSGLSNDLGFGGSDSPRQGADTPAWLAVSPEVRGMTGGYFEQRTPVRCPFMEMKDESARLLEMCGTF